MLQRLIRLRPNPLRTRLRPKHQQLLRTITVAVLTTQVPPLLLQQHQQYHRHLRR